MFACFADSGNH